MKRRNALAALWLVGTILATILLLRTFVADVYRVDSGSMAPTIHGGESIDEWVLVRYDGAEGLSRFDLAVAYSGDGTPIVKRTVGLPGESVQLLGGDLFINGRRLGVDIPRAQPVPLFDSSLHRIADEFELDSGVWSESKGVWLLDSRTGTEAVESNLLRWKTGLDDGYLLPDDSRTTGTRNVTDGGVDFEAELVGLDGTLRIELREAGDCFRATLELNADPEQPGVLHAIARIERLRIMLVVDAEMQSARLIEPELLVEEELELKALSTQAIHFSNIDNGLVLRIGETLLDAGYEENRPLENLSLAPGKTIGPQVALGGDGLQLKLKKLRIARDLSWTPRGDFGVNRPIALGPNEYFLLGDNSAQSLDGRSWGATPRVEILGRPVKVIWPRNRSRTLIDDLWLRKAE